MIQPPRRSVTRFFIPLIDVLTLLFCIFLVMPPTVKTQVVAEKGESREKAPTVRVPEAERELKEREKEIKRLQELLNRDWRTEKTAGRVLEIDGNGKLFYYKDALTPEGRRVPERLPDRETVARMVRTDQRLVDKDVRLSYVVRMPDDPNRIPGDDVVDAWKSWFKDLVPLSFDNGRLGRKQESSQ